MKRFLIVSGVVVGIIILFFLGLYLYLTFVTKSYADRNYNFVILDLRGWQVTEHPKGIYFSMATKDQRGNSVSTFEIIPKKVMSIDSNQIYKNFEKDCFGSADMFTDGQKPQIIPIKELTIVGWMCSYEGYSLAIPNFNKLSILREYVLYKKGDQHRVFLINVTYPKDNPEELKKVNTLIDTFIIN